MTDTRDSAAHADRACSGDTPPGQVAGNSPAVDGLPPAGAFSPLKVLDLFSGHKIREDGVVISRLGRRVKHQVSHNGYVRVELWENGKGKKYLLHRLLAQAFIDNPVGKPQVNHIDGDKTNNKLSNLEWVTQSENQIHAYKTGLQVGYRKPGPLSPEHKAALCGSAWKGQKRTYIAEGLRFSSPEAVADHFGVNRQTVYNRTKSPNFPEWKIEVRREEK